MPAGYDLLLLNRIFGLRQLRVGFVHDVLLGGFGVTVNARHSVEIVCGRAVDLGHPAVVGSQLAVYFVARFETGRLCRLFPHRVGGFELLLQVGGFFRQRLIVRGLSLQRLRCWRHHIGSNDHVASDAGRRNISHQ
ncbi:hypothetical protein [Mycobacterium intracellulare]|uniref:hypothetical protein n=1 Tax=Mycobacterium intracellulare TaxID=1767 RepID=UPI001FF91E1A|nr:hypothetical protein [Mycobacterium intracellulare]